MAQTLTVKLVNRQEWDQITHSDSRYAHVTEDDLGFSNPEQQVAYVRQTAIPELNRYLVNHEVGHLLEERGTDEDEFGVRHKRGFLRNAAAILAAPFTLGSSLAVGNEKQRPVIGAPGNPVNRIANAAYQTIPAAAGGVIGGSVGGPLGAAAGAGLGSAVGNVATARPAVGKTALIEAGIGGAGQAALNAFGGPSSTMPSSVPIPPLTPGIGSPGAVGQPSAIPSLPQLPSTPPVPSPAQAPSVPPVISPIRPGGGGMGGSGVGSLVPSLGTASTSTLSGIGQGVAPRIASGSLTNPYAGSPLQNLNLPQGGAPGGGGTPPPVTGQPQQAQGGQGNFLSRIFGGFLTSVGGGAAQGFGQSLGQNIGSFVRENAGQVARTGAGLAIAKAGINEAPKVQIPDLAQTPGIQQFKSDVQQRLGPPPTAAVGGLTQRAQNLGNTPLPQGIADSINRQYDLLKHDIVGQFKAFRPGADLATDSQFRQTVEDVERRRSEALTQAQFQYMGEARQNLLAEAGIDAQHLPFLENIANLDAQTIALRTGVSAEEANQFKQIFGGIGAVTAAGGFSPLNRFGP